MSAPRTQHKPEESEPETQMSHPLIEHLQGGFQGVHLHLDQLSARIEAANPGLYDPRAKDGAENTKITRRRSLDEMESAMRRLLAPEPRPRDDDSAQVMHDAITELILQRQLVADLMQAATNSYQHGLAAVRKMTER